MIVSSCASVMPFKVREPLFMKMILLIELGAHSGLAGLLL
jgi:hypothetical protein